MVETLTVADRVAVISFSSGAFQIGYNTLVRATNNNKARLVQAIKNLNANGGTNFAAAFQTTFDTLDKTIQAESTSGCNIAVLFMTDGQISQGPGPEESFNSLMIEQHRLLLSLTEKQQSSPSH